MLKINLRFTREQYLSPSLIQYSVSIILTLKIKKVYFSIFWHPEPHQEHQILELSCFWELRNICCVENNYEKILFVIHEKINSMWFREKHELFIWVNDHQNPDATFRPDQLLTITSLELLKSLSHLRVKWLVFTFATARL